jgi:ABC-type methionine transport system ATPase subunit
MTPRAPRFRISGPKKLRSEPIIHRLSRDCGVVPHILRGRITPKDAWLEVELTGPRKSVEKALKFLGARGVSVRKLPD